jgi:hypothetical protein
LGSNAAPKGPDLLALALDVVGPLGIGVDRGREDRDRIVKALARVDV